MDATTTTMEINMVMICPPTHKDGNAENGCDVIVTQITSKMIMTIWTLITIESMITIMVLHHRRALEGLQRRHARAAEGVGGREGGEACLSLRVKVRHREERQASSGRGRDGKLRAEAKIARANMYRCA